MLKKNEILEKIMSVSYKKIFKPLIDCDINGLTCLRNNPMTKNNQNVTVKITLNYVKHLIAK